MEHELNTIELSSDELTLFFDMLNQINYNIKQLNEVEEIEPIPHKESQLYQLEMINEQLDYIINPSPSEPLPEDETELYQLKTLNQSLNTLNEHNSLTYYEDIDGLNDTMAELTESFQDYQDYHYSTNQLYQFSTLLIFPMAITYVVYRIIKKFIY